MNTDSNGNLRKSPPRLRGFGRFFSCKYSKRPLLVNLEITKRCNAKCRFCACWQVKSPDELGDYAPVVRKLRPVVVSVSGGEPLVRRDCYELIRGMRPYCHYLVMITNGTLLSEDVAEKLSDVGVNQLAVSVDFMDDRHDELRGIPGLFKKISKTIPLLTSKGYKIVLNTVIMETNLEHIIPLAHQAKAWGAGISFSSFCSLKRKTGEMMVRQTRSGELERIVEELKVIKGKLGHIRNSYYYLDGIVRYFREGGIGNCRAGKNWVQVTPTGDIQPCSEMPRICSYEEYDQSKVPEITCTNCWYTCRGEAEAPKLAPKKLWDLIRA